MNTTKSKTYLLKIYDSTRSSTPLLLYSPTPLPRHSPTRITKAHLVILLSQLVGAPIQPGWAILPGLSTGRVAAVRFEPEGGRDPILPVPIYGSLNPYPPTFRCLMAIWCRHQMAWQNRGFGFDQAAWFETGSRLIPRILAHAEALIGYDAEMRYGIELVLRYALARP